MTIVANPLFNPAPAADIETSLAERTACVDRLVKDAAAELLLAEVPAGVAVLAVGGYGRRHLFPYSDVDLLLLFESERLPLAHKSAIAAFLQRLWDSKLRVSHSVRTPAECAEVHDQNIELNVSLLDQRFLTGDRNLYADLARRLPKFLLANRDTLVRNLAQLTRERHVKYAGTIYHLEPNVKEAPGGLRDYQLLCWLEQMRGSASGEMAWTGVPSDARDAFRFLGGLRWFLHCQAGRDNNVLSFNAQDDIAAESGAADPAAWMREYFRHSRAVYRAATRALEEREAHSSALFAQFREWRSRLANADFSVHRERAHFRSPQALDAGPELLLRLFEFVARHGIRLSAEAEQRIESRLPRIREWFTEPRPMWPALAQILALPHAVLAVRSMHETGVLTAMFPEIEQIECLVVRDFYHRYTVDEHTLVAMQSVALAGGAYAGLLTELQQPALLLFALLFHDVGKGSRGGHVDGSVRLARGAMARIQMPAQDQETVLFLIAKHLELSKVMQSRDLFDPPTVRAVAREIGTVERLKALTFLTYADISAVNPEAMTPWRAEQLWQLYLTVYNELTRELETDRIDSIVLGPPERSAFLQGFPTRYLRTHTEQEIAAHVALEEKSRARGVAAELRRMEAAWQLTVVTTDRPRLFASIAGTLAGFGMNILRAEAFSNRRGLILDTFAFADPNRTLELNPTEVDRLRTVLERTVLGKTDVAQLLRNRPKPVLLTRSARIASSIAFNSSASEAATLVEIVAEDRPGLLYDLASAISSNGCNIEVVLIDTQAHKAIDVFYVTAGGKKLTGDQQNALREALRNAIGPGTAETRK